VLCERITGTGFCKVSGFYLGACLFEFLCMLPATQMIAEILTDCPFSHTLVFYLFRRKVCKHRILDFLIPSYLSNTAVLVWLLGWGILL
jgi:hypothetical protein